MTRIAIIGGGCAGLGAAYTLLRRIPADSDHRVALYEAFDRLGGRAWTRTTLDGIAFDLGPQYIQDPDPEVNPWIGIIDILNQWLPPDQQLEVIQPAIDSQWRVNTSNGWQTVGFPPEAILNNEMTMRNGFTAAENTSNQPALYQSLGNTQEAQLGQFAGGIGPLVESAEAWQYIASDSARQADVQPGEGQNLDNKYVKQGIGFLVHTFGRYLQATYQAPVFTVTLGQTVTKIEQAGNEIKITVNGQESTFDYCIVTASTTTLQNIAFVPPFTYERNRALSYVRLGSYKKVAFIPAQMPEGLAENTEYSLFDGEGCWMYFRLPTNSSLLVGVAAGNYAAVLDRLDDDAAAQRFVQALNTAYGANSVQLPPNCIVTNWSRQFHVRGAYSFTRYDGGDPADPFPLSAREVITQPMGRIHFAGEATWTEAYATIHGAYKSGKRAADVILEAVGL